MKICMEYSFFFYRNNKNRWGDIFWFQKKKKKIF